MVLPMVPQRLSPNVIVKSRQERTELLTRGVHIGSLLGKGASGSAYLCYAKERFDDQGYPLKVSLFCSPNLRLSTV